VAVALWRTQKPSAPLAVNPRILLAVLPFENIGNDQAQEYFCDGMTEEMILHLSRLAPQRLAVIARTSSMRYRATNKRADEIALELGGVEYLLTGSVRRLGDRVRITAQLVQAREQTNLWGESYERPLADVFQIQSEVARRIARSLAIELLPAQQAALERPPTTNPQAYEAYLRGRFYWNLRGEDNLKEGLKYFQQAVQRDPQFVLAYTGLADSYNVLGYYGAQAPSELFPRSKGAAQQALALDQNSSEALTALAYATRHFDWNWAEAEQLFRRAAAANPNYAPARHWYAAHLAALGRVEEAQAEMRRALELDPQSLISNALQGLIHYRARDNVAAEGQLRRTLEQDPEFLPAHMWLGQVYEQMKKYAEAAEQFHKVIELSTSSPWGRAELARVYALQGQKAEAEALLTDLLRLGKQRYVEADLIARIYLALGRPEEALAWLEKALEQRSSSMILLGGDPRYDPIRHTPRFQALLRRMNLPVL
jgi:TolB-like protein/Flp pilus assembly protein TadD